MATQTRKIGLSLGADLCWPSAFEELVRGLDLEIPAPDDSGDMVRFEVERVTVEPFDLDAPRKYDVVIDRLTHWFHTSREWVKKIVLDGSYTLNNPWATQSMEKHTSYVAMMKLGMPIPKTMMLPPKEYERGADWDATVTRYNRLFDLGAVGEEVGYPAFLKPYDGGGWVGVVRVTDEATLRAAYDASGKRVHHLQAAVKDWDLFIRAIGIGPQVNVIKYDPDQPLHDRYRVDFNFLDAEGYRTAARTCRTINAFFGWDFNSCEMLRTAEELNPIDFANACPDSQVTSLHYHFPWLVMALVKWTLFCAWSERSSGKKMTLQWERFLAARDESLSYDEQLDVYDAIAREYYDTDAFEAFCEAHLQGLDELALEFFGTDRFKEIVRRKVAALFPDHEVDTFTNHFYGMVQFWRKTERDRLGLP